MRVLSRASSSRFRTETPPFKLFVLGKRRASNRRQKTGRSLARARFFFFLQGSRESLSARPSHRLASHPNLSRSTASASRAGSSSAAAAGGVVCKFASRCYPTARLFPRRRAEDACHLGAAVPTAAAARRPARLSVPRPRPGLSDDARRREGRARGVRGMVRLERLVSVAEERGDGRSEGRHHRQVQRHVVPVQGAHGHEGLEDFMQQIREKCGIPEERCSA